MLVLIRRKDESVIINDNIKVTVLQVGKSSIRVGIEAPEDVKILRNELKEKIDEA